MDEVLRLRLDLMRVNREAARGLDFKGWVIVQNEFVVAYHQDKKEAYRIARQSGWFRADMDHLVFYKS